MLSLVVCDDTLLDDDDTRSRAEQPDAEQCALLSLVATINQRSREQPASRRQTRMCYRKAADRLGWMTQADSNQ